MKTMLTCMLMWLANVLQANTTDQSFNTSSGLRILQLLPNLCIPLAIDPAIPNDFVAMSPNGNVDVYNWVYWGPKDVLETYFKTDSLKSPVLRVKLSTNTRQTGANSFSDDAKVDEMKKNGPAGFLSSKMMWGDYPVHALQTTVMDQTIYMAWVGLNDPQAGWTLMFNLVYPQEEGHPDKQDLALWENFLSGTKKLSEPDVFKVHGQDMQEGYTIVTLVGAKFKMIAEKREKDGMLQVVVIPFSARNKFDYIDMEEGKLGTEWKYDKPLLKVIGNFNIEDGEFNAIVDRHVSSILLKTVPEFSYSLQEAKGRNDLFVYQKSVKPSA
ncbi:MAG: hypothetical protein JSR46_01320 [Verrucomicrobia bacterium]|nr:hypothetical protein [Verrucomicrobiota bacterium]